MSLGAPWRRGGIIAGLCMNPDTKIVFLDPQFQHYFALVIQLAFVVEVSRSALERTSSGQHSGTYLWLRNPKPEIM